MLISATAIGTATYLDTYRQDSCIVIRIPTGSRAIGGSFAFRLRRPVRTKQTPSGHGNFGADGIP